MSLIRSSSARTMSDLQELIGTEIAVSNWVVVDQDLIDEFGRCTNDEQWIHTDPERAKAESPYGGTVAHGFLLLSLLTRLQRDSHSWPSDISSIVNYGLERVRFISPVTVDAEIRIRVKLAKLEHRKKGAVFLQLDNTMELRGSEKPALAASSLLMAFPSEERVDA
ncbi:MaoC family dehydratase [Ruegeria sp. SCP11]|uniref:MaoC family dehydratase n=1 Tax=Ruegeria sp. SCP11 TaxID=3141378 RepID=UPI00333AC8F0